MGRQDQYANTATVNGRSLGIFDTFKGGEVDSEETKHKAGGLQPAVALGGTVNVGNVTVGRLYERERDHELVRWLMTQAGWAPATVSRQPLDAHGNPYGKPIVYTGVLKSITPADTDSNSSDADTFELEVSTNGTVG